MGEIAGMKDVALDIDPYGMQDFFHIPAELFYCDQIYVIEDSLVENSFNPIRLYERLMKDL